MKIKPRPFVLERRRVARAEPPLVYVCDLAELDAKRSEGTSGDVRFIVQRDRPGRARLYSQNLRPTRRPKIAPGSNGTAAP
jgi:hypothetical protein